MCRLYRCDKNKSIKRAILARRNLNEHFCDKSVCFENERQRAQGLFTFEHWIIDKLKKSPKLGSSLTFNFVCWLFWTSHNTNKSHKYILTFKYKIIDSKDRSLVKQAREAPWCIMSYLALVAIWAHSRLQYERNQAARKSNWEGGFREQVHQVSGMDKWTKYTFEVKSKLSY